MHPSVQSPRARGRRSIAPILRLVFAAVIVGLVGRGAPLCAADPPEPKFTSTPAVAARNRYVLLVDQARAQMVTELKAALKESMQASQLDEANRISRIVDGKGEDSGEALTSAKARNARNRFDASAKRAKQEYLGALKNALAQSLRSAQLDESNLISAEIKKLEAMTAKQADPTTGFINLLPIIDPAKDTVAGKWSIEKGALVSSGEGEERIEIPYQPPEEYDYRITFTKTGTNCVIQILSGMGTSFIWAMDAKGFFTFRYLKGTGIGSNKTSVQKPAGIKDNHRYTSLVRVRKNGVEALVENKLMTKWETDYSDVAGGPWWALKNSKLLGLGTGSSKTTFHTIEVKEVGGSGKFLR
jgi:hypothetical protein